MVVASTSCAAKREVWETGTLWLSLSMPVSIAPQLLVLCPVLFCFLLFPQGITLYPCSVLPCLSGRSSPSFHNQTPMCLEPQVECACCWCLFSSQTHQYGLCCKIVMSCHVTVLKWYIRCILNKIQSSIPAGRLLLILAFPFDRIRTCRGFTFYYTNSLYRVADSFRYSYQPQLPLFMPSVRIHDKHRTLNRTLF